jgi:lipopolysaccharide transport protein LptA
MIAMKRQWTLVCLVISTALLGLLMGASAEVENLFKSDGTADGAKKPRSTIEADYLNFDYDTKIGTFEGNVHVLDAQLELFCKRMIMFLDKKNNEVIRVEAYNNVHILQQGKEAFSEKAVYTRETGLIVLTEGTPKMKDEKGNWIEGASIIYNTQTKIMKVDKPKLNFTTSGGNIMGPATTSPTPSSTTPPATSPTTR